MKILTIFNKLIINLIQIYKITKNNFNIMKVNKLMKKKINQNNNLKNNLFKKIIRSMIFNNLIKINLKITK